MNELSIRSVSKSFGGNKALDDISIDLIPKKINLLIGSNGCGKTTLINAISGNTQIDNGNIVFADKDITQNAINHRFNLGMIRTFQTPRLFSSLSVLENLMICQHSAGERFKNSLIPKRWKSQENSIKQKALSVLDSLNLTKLKNSLAYDLSGGQIKLVELAKTLMSDSKLVLLDEPIAGIAPKLAHDIFETICSMSKDHGITFLIVEHRLDIALQYSDWVFVMNEGRIIANDSPDKILQDKAVIDSYLR